LALLRDELKDEVVGAGSWDAFLERKACYRLVWNVVIGLPEFVLGEKEGE